VGAVTEPHAVRRLLGALGLAAQPPPRCTLRRHTRIMRSALALCLLAALISACGNPTGATAGPAVIPVTLPSGKVLQSEVMANDADRQMGLMFRPSLAQDRALLFVFEQAGRYSFWMKNGKFPIDMVWMDESRKVVEIVANVPPCQNDPCPSYGGMQRSLYVLEVNAGQAAREKVTLGATLEFMLPAN
jgi:uncharacterized membrane protein (UPF0127 family)